MWTDTWENEEDVERDLLLMAEYNFPNPENLNPELNKVPETILKYRKQIKENTEKVLNSDIDEGAFYVVSGRGRGIPDRILRPGGRIETHPLDELELKKEIREVAGFGYSNELIEKAINAKAKPLSKERDSVFKLASISASSSSTSDEKSSTESIANIPTKSKK